MRVMSAICVRWEDIYNKDVGTDRLVLQSRSDHTIATVKVF